MIIDDTENGDLDYTTDNFEILSKGIVIFPETLEEAQEIKRLKKRLIRDYE
jgi:uncharacterized protein YutE (UPF0331/DUF86 family)